MGERAELHVAEELVDPDLLVPEHLLQALLGRPDDDHVLLGVPVDVDVALDGGLEQREHRLLLLGCEVGQLPLECELGEVLVPPANRVPQAVARSALGILGAVHQGVDADAVVHDPGQRLGQVGLGLAVGLDVPGHDLDGLQQGERQQAQTLAPGRGGGRLAGRSQPGRRVRVLVGLGRLHAFGHGDQIAVPADPLLLPRLDHELDTLAPHRP